MFAPTFNMSYPSSSRDGFEPEKVRTPVALTGIERALSDTKYRNCKSTDCTRCDEEPENPIIEG